MPHLAMLLESLRPTRHGSALFLGGESGDLAHNPVGHAEQLQPLVRSRVRWAVNVLQGGSFKARFPGYDLAENL
jgi:hypothetical protein